MLPRHTYAENPTIFGQILRGELPCDKVYEDADVLAFHDKYPNAPIHVLIIPKQHFIGMQDAQPDDAAILGKLMLAAVHVADKLGVKESGFRLATNAGEGAGQAVPHLHLHLLAPQPGSSEKLKEL